MGVRSWIGSVNECFMPHNGPIPEHESCGRAVILDIEACPVFCFQGDADVQVAHPFRINQQPIAPTGEDSPAEACSLKMPPSDIED